MEREKPPLPKINLLDLENIAESAQKALELSTVYQRQSESGKKILEEVALALGVWTWERFPTEQIGRISYSRARIVFNDIPVVPGDKNSQPPRNHFTDTLLQLPLEIHNPKMFLNGLFRQLYLGLGGKE